MPKANLEFMHFISSRHWQYETNDTAKAILEPGYFDKVQGLRPEDEIGVISFSEIPAQHFMLVVDSVEQKALQKVRVSILAEFKRARAA
jgi:hypothetical protein